MIVIGIDPGLKGGIAWCHRAMEGTTFGVLPLPTFKSNKKNEIDADALNKIFADLACWDEAIQLTVIERVHSMPKQGIVGAFTFGEGYGKVKAIAELFSEKIEYPIPQKWKKVVLKGTNRDKQAAIDFVHKNYPALSLRPSSRHRTDHDGMADAICLMHYGRMLLNGKDI